MCCFRVARDDAVARQLQGEREMCCFMLPGTTRLPGSYKENDRCVVSCCQGRHGCQAATRRMRDELFRVARDDTVARQLQGE